MYCLLTFVAFTMLMIPNLIFANTCIKHVAYIEFYYLEKYAFFCILARSQFGNYMHFCKTVISNSLLHFAYKCNVILTLFFKKYCFKPTAKKFMVFTLRQDIHEYLIHSEYSFTITKNNNDS